MAEGYARETGRIGVCIATSGPGATNLITGVADAYVTEIPLLVITGQPMLANHGRRALQDSSCTGVNILGMFQQCTRYNALISHPSQVESHLINALMRAQQLPRGPAHLSVPVDVLRAPVSPSSPPHIEISLRRPTLATNAEAVSALASEFLRAMPY
jgi:acetolactate synthase-1/2/3 large subunit